MKAEYISEDGFDAYYGPGGKRQVLAAQDVTTKVCKDFTDRLADIPLMCDGPVSMHALYVECIAPKAFMVMANNYFSSLSAAMLMEGVSTEEAVDTYYEVYKALSAELEKLAQKSASKYVAALQAGQKDTPSEGENND